MALLDAHAAELDRRIADLTGLREQVRRLRERSKDLDPARCNASTVCDIIPGNDRRLQAEYACRSTGTR